MNQKEKEILTYMSKLKISREEAEQLWRDDQSDEMLPEVAEMTQKAKEMGRRYEKSDKTRKASSRERKVDEQKKQILETLLPSLVSLGAEITDIQTETQISFSFLGSSYSVKLTKHRNK